MTISVDTSAYIFECCCGERFNNVVAASNCKKCRSYSVWGHTKYVINTETEAVVHGELPTDEEYIAAEAEAIARWEEEAREFAEWKAEQDSEYERYLQEQAAGEAEAAILEVEAEEDELWEVQENLMK